MINRYFSTVILFMMLMATLISGTGAQDEFPPITVENADQLTALQQIGRGVVVDLAWSADGETLMAGTSDLIWLLDPTDLDGEAAWLDLGLDDSLMTMAYRPGDGLLVALMRNKFQIWDTASQTMLASWDQRGGELVAIHPTEALIALGSRRDIVLLSLDSGEEILRITEGISKPIKALAFSPDGHLLAGGDEAGNIQIWQMPDGSVAGTVTMNAMITALQFSSDSAILYATATDQTLHAWHAADWSEMLTLESETDMISEMAINQAGSTIILPEAYADGLRFLNTETGAEDVVTVTSSRALNPYPQIAMHPDQRLLAAVPGSGQLQIWDAETAEMLTASNLFTRRSMNVIFDSPETMMVRYDYQIGRWYLPNGSFIEAWDDMSQVPPENDPKRTKEPVYSPDGSRYILMDFSTSNLYNAATNEILYELIPGRVAFNSDGSLLAIYGYELSLIDVATGDILVQQFSPGSNPTGVAFSDDDRFIVTTNLDGVVMLWGIAP